MSKALRRRYGRSHPSTIKVLGRDYAVSTRTSTRHPEEGVIYELRGVRGAKYATVRNKNHPHQMFLVHDGRGFGIPAGFDGVWLSDEGGTLRVIR